MKGRRNVGCRVSRAKNDYISGGRVSAMLNNVHDTGRSCVNGGMGGSS